MGKLEKLILGVALFIGLNVIFSSKIIWVIGIGAVLLFWLAAQLETKYIKFKKTREEKLKAKNKVKEF